MIIRLVSRNDYEMKRQLPTTASLSVKKRRYGGDGSKLPADVILLIMKSASPRTFCSMRRTCARYRDIGGTLVMEKKRYHADHSRSLPLNMAIKLRSPEIVESIIERGAVDYGQPALIYKLIKYDTIECLHAIFRGYQKQLKQTGTDFDFPTDRQQHHCSQIVGDKPIHGLLRFIGHLSSHCYNYTAIPYMIANYLPLVKWWFEGRPHIHIRPTLDCMYIVRQACIYDRLSIIEEMMNIHPHLYLTKNIILGCANTVEQFERLEKIYGCADQATIVTMVQGQFSWSVFKHCFINTPVLLGTELTELVMSWLVDYDPALRAQRQGLRVTPQRRAAYQLLYRFGQRLISGADVLVPRQK